MVLPLFRERIGEPCKPARAHADRKILPFDVRRANTLRIGLRRASLHNLPYVGRPSSVVDDLYYYLEDRYMTARKYDLDANVDILASEKREILARLRRLRPQQRAPH